MDAFRHLLIVALLGALAAASHAAATDSALPAWAYPVNPPGLQPPPDDGTWRHVPGSTAAFTLTQIRNLFATPDWHPDDHPAMPVIVATGRKPEVYACAYCHLPNGLGRPENASLAGLPAAYIVQHLADFRSGARKSAEPASLPVNLMIAVAKAATDSDVQAAAEYFAELKPRPWIRVVECARVPRTHVTGWMLVATEPAAMEPIGQRIIEMPEDLVRTELRDAQSGFVAFVPTGSIERGEALVTTGAAGKTMACSSCHGADLKGLPPITPAIAGRSPSYLVRQLYDIQHGFRNGVGVAPMRTVVAKLEQGDMIAIAAYLASRAP